MELIIDANVVISAIISLRGKTRDLLFQDSIRLFAPEYLIEEFEKHKKEVIRKSGLSEKEFDLALSLIFSRIDFVPFSDFGIFIRKAEKISPDENDTEYFALALKLGIPIWSDDKLLKQQKIVKVYSTIELLKKLDM